MQKPLVQPLSTVNNPELEELVHFFNETLGFCPNSVLTMQRRPHLANIRKKEADKNNLIDIGSVVL